VAGPDDAVLVGVDGDLDAFAQVELGQDASDVGLDGRLAERGRALSQLVTGSSVIAD
jgi:hypothetical protein